MRAIDYDILDNDVAAFVRNLNDFEKQVLELGIEEMLDRLAEIGRNAAQSVFGSTTTVSIQSGKKSRKIVADGTDEAYFVEFGTGVYAGTNSGLYEAIPDGVSPGSYSESDKGKHTWSYWINAGYGEETYPYNSQPRSAMFQAFTAIRNNLETVAKGVFG